MHFCRKKFSTGGLEGVTGRHGVQTVCEPYQLGLFFVCSSSVLRSRAQIELAINVLQKINLLAECQSAECQSTAEICSAISAYKDTTFFETKIKKMLKEAIKFRIWSYSGTFHRYNKKNDRYMEPINIQELNDRIGRESAFVDVLQMELGKQIVGQKHMVESLMIGLLSNGHVLLEGVPGLAKTLTITTLARAIDAKFSRIQFTPDLLPADLLGTMIYSQKSEQFQVKKGPIFSNFILADEINRAPAKVQSALLEAMQERQVTIGEQTFRLEEPFLVMATQNPIEQEGTYPLPEAQVDRFMLKVVITYPKRDEERLILHQAIAGERMAAQQPILKPQDILKARELVREVYMDEKIETYITDIVFATRFPEQYGLEKLKPLVSYGSSPRGSINLAAAAKAYAFLKRRGYVIPEDVRAIAMDVLRHRIGLTYEAEAENVTSEELVNEVLNRVDVP